jgi:hypothetical protein
MKLGKGNTLNTRQTDLKTVKWVSVTLFALKCPFPCVSVSVFEQEHRYDLVYSKLLNLKVAVADISYTAAQSHLYAVMSGSELSCLLRLKYCFFN